MPTLDFKGKQFVYSHHLSVPFRELRIDPDKSLPAPGKTPSLDDNLIIHGDNLEALKALLPTHAGKVDCIFIDPPYNTGNEGWCYNDNVRSPLMQEWLKKSANPVDKEDLERHDKWLCMMWPRLSLLKELLSEQGSIWITLDDNEVQRCKIVMDEIFGEDNFITTCIWHKVYSPKNTAQFFSEDHDFILVYAKDKSNWKPHQLERTDEMTARYLNPDNDPRGPWKPSDLTARNAYSKGKYEVKGPTGRTFTSGTRYWRQSYESFLALNEDNRIWWGADGSNMPQQKRFLSEVKDGRTPQTIWSYKEVGHTQDAKKELLDIMSFGDSDDVFISPKPSSLIDRILELATDDNSIILDSFAGTGTTAHAVLKANNKDSGRRKFIMIECESYADNLTAERVRRVINGYEFSGNQKVELLKEPITWSVFEKKHSKILEQIASIEQKHSKSFDNIKKQIVDGVLTITGERKISSKAPGLDGSFAYCSLGNPINIDDILTGTEMPSFESLARYVFYTATGSSVDVIAKASVDGFIGETDLFRIHLFYQPDTNWLRSNEAALNSEKVKAILQSNMTKKRTIVFAVAKFMSQKELTAHRIEFCQLPYAIHRIMGA